MDQIRKDNGPNIPGILAESPARVRARRPASAVRCSSARLDRSFCRRRRRRSQHSFATLRHPSTSDDVLHAARHRLAQSRSTRRKPQILRERQQCRSAVQLVTNGVKITEYHR
jgi:hypothetical protein